MLSWCEDTQGRNGYLQGGIYFILCIWDVIFICIPESVFLTIERQLCSSLSVSGKGTQWHQGHKSTLNTHSWPKESKFRCLRIHEYWECNWYIFGRIGYYEVSSCLLTEESTVPTTVSYCCQFLTRSFLIFLWCTNFLFHFCCERQYHKRKQQSQCHHLQTVNVISGFTESIFHSNFSYFFF